MNHLEDLKLQQVGKAGECVSDRIAVIAGVGRGVNDFQQGSGESPFRFLPKLIQLSVQLCEVIGVAAIRIAEFPLRDIQGDIFQYRGAESGIRKVHAEPMDHPLGAGHDESAAECG